MPTQKKGGRPETASFPLRFLLRHRYLLFIAEPVLSRVLRDTRCRDHHRHVLPGFPWKQVRDTIVIRIGTLLLAGDLTHQAPDPVLASVVCCRGEVPRAESVVQIGQVRQRCIRCLIRMVALVYALVDRKAIALTGFTDELPQSTSSLR